MAQPLLGAIADTLGVGTGAAGVVVSATQLGYACGLVLIVPLGDVIAPRRLVATLSFLSAGALAVAAAAPTFAVLLGAMAVVGALAVVIQVLVALGRPPWPPPASGAGRSGSSPAASSSASSPPGPPPA